MGNATHIDELIVTHSEEPPQFHKLDRAILMIGRDDTNDIALNSAAVSRNHARLEKRGDGWFIVDLGSTNGSYLAGERLIASKEEMWRSGYPLQIGPYTLQWQSQRDVNKAQTLVLQPGEFVMPEDETIIDDSLSLTLSAEQIELRPNETVEVRLGILAASQLNKQLEVAVQGVPSNWVSLSRVQVKLAPKRHESVELRFRLPPSGLARTGEWPYRVVVRNVHNPLLEASIDGILLIPAISDFAIVLQQLTPRNSSPLRLRLQNMGNAATSFTIEAETDNAVEISGEQWDVALMPGSATDLDYHIRAPKRPLVGEVKHATFAFRAITNYGQQKRVAGRLDIAPLIAAWLVVTLVTLTLLLLIVLAISV